MDYEKMWIELKNTITKDLKLLSDPSYELDSAVAFRIAGEKTALNTMNKMEREEIECTKRK